MALGDLVTADYIYEYNELALGVTTNYDLEGVEFIQGFGIRSERIERFGRHGATAGRHYALGKSVIFTGHIRAATDAAYETNRRALGSAFAPIVSPVNKLPLVTQFPGTGSTKVQAEARTLNLVIPINRQHARMYGGFTIRMEVPNPILYSLTSTTTNFAVPTDTENITNGGNAPAKWIATLVGPADDPILTNNDTSQVLDLTGLTLSGAEETLVYDSYDSTVKVNGASVGTSLATGFSWFDFDPGVNNIKFEATNAATASFSITHNDAYWSV